MIKLYFLGLALLAVVSLGLGVVFPFLISAKDSFLVALGLGTFFIVFVPFVAYLGQQFVKTLTKKTEESENS